MERLADGGHMQTNRPLTPSLQKPSLTPVCDGFFFSVFPWPPVQDTTSALIHRVAKVGFLTTLHQGKFQVTGSLKIGITSYPPFFVYVT